MAKLTGILGDVDSRLKKLEDNQDLDVSGVNQEMLESIKSLYGDRYQINVLKQGDGYVVGIFMKSQSEGGNYNA